MTWKSAHKHVGIVTCSSEYVQPTPIEPPLPPDGTPPLLSAYKSLWTEIQYYRLFLYTATLDTSPLSTYRHPRYTATLDISPPSKHRHKIRWTNRVGTVAARLTVFRETVGVLAVVLLLQFCSTVVCSNAPSYWPCFDTNENVFCYFAIWVLYLFARTTPEYVSKKKKD